MEYKYLAMIALSLTAVIVCAIGYKDSMEKRQIGVALLNMFFIFANTFFVLLNLYRLLANKG